MGLGALIFVACLAQGYNTQAWIVLRGLSLIVLGLVLDMEAQVLASPLEQLGAALLLAFAFVGVISLGGLMFAHSNPSLRRIGTLLSSSLNILLLAVLTALLTIYLMVFRPLLETNYEPLMVLIEWLAVALVAAIIGIRFYLYFRRRSAPPVMGDWTVLVQKVSFEEGDLARATAAVRAFIDKGRKEGMVVLLTSTLVANHVPEERVEKIMQRIINYQQPRFSLLFRWTYGDLEGNLRQARAQMVVAALQEAAEEVGARYLSSGLQVGREKKVQEA
jgi:hypothetical protein